MPRFAANLFMLFKERPMLERFAAARDAGFSAVELLFPYEAPAKALARALEASGLPMILINTPPPDWHAGDRGLAAIPGQKDAFRASFDRALDYAEALDTGMIHVMAGRAEGKAAHQTFVDNLTWAAAQAPERQLTLEPINPHDMPGYFLRDFDQAARIIDQVGAPNLGLQFDTYHAHKITGDMLATWDRHRARAVHVQVAEPAGRHEPGNGIIDHPAFFAQLDAEGYRGFISGEYFPKARTEDGLGWIR